MLGRILKYERFCDHSEQYGGSAPESGWRKAHVPVFPLKYTIDGETYTDMYGLSAKEFFDKLREGHMSVTSQINPEEAVQMMEPYVKEGKDILHLGFSSGLSGTLNSMRLAGRSVGEISGGKDYSYRYPLCLPGRRTSSSPALKERQGKTIDEIAAWAEENKLHICHDVTVDDLNHLHRGGRVSKTTAVLGTLVQIKPIIHMDNAGKLQVIGKERGRKRSLNRIVDMAWNSQRAGTTILS